MTGSTGAVPKGSRRFVGLLFCLVAVALFLSDRGQIDGDGRVRWRALQELAEHGRLTRDAYSIVQPLLALPLYGLGAAAASLRSPESPEGRREHREAVERNTVARFNKVIAFLICLLCYRIAREVFRFTQAQAAGTVLLVLFGTMLIPHARDFYSECSWTLGSLAILWLVSRSDGVPAGGLIALLAVTVALNPVLAAVFAIVVLAGLPGSGDARPRRLAVLGLAGLAAGTSLVLLENFLRRGSAWTTGYEGAGFSTPLVTGLLGEFFAPARGILFFLPAWLVGWFLAATASGASEPAERRFLRLSLVYSAILLLVYAKWQAWHGGWYWGPRFLLPLSILGALCLALLFARRWHSPPARLAALCLAVISFLVYKVGAAVNQSHLLECLRASADETACYWNLAYTPLASLFSREDLVRMATHRSTAVEAGTLILFGLLLFSSREPQRGLGEKGAS